MVHEYFVMLDTKDGLREYGTIRIQPREYETKGANKAFDPFFFFFFLQRNLRFKFYLQF